MINYNMCLHRDSVIKNKCRGKKRICCAKSDCKLVDKKSVAKIVFVNKRRNNNAASRRASNPIHMHQQQNDVIEASDDVN